ncbi:GPI ethanolamine phosphate transferase 3 [Planococcus citri]|uniref:GPI ethanolamine phosphate transferase 3 n=1 Tax=Planococcus citri TaxID=170843 RepID=UPI0031F78F0D
MKLNDYGRTIFFLVWICSSFIISVLIFTSGLLLHREELHYQSICRNNSTHPKTDGGNTYEQHCSPSNLKVILIIIDALRYDFVEHSNVPKEEELPYQNKLTVIHDILRTKPKNAKLFKFVADPPTTTMQRIKALTTGCLSTFIDISSNFASGEIEEDNLIDNLIRRSKNAVFMGDDTWTRLYPNQFIRSYPYDSFNVWDLDTVDNGVKEHILPELKKTDWNLLIGHFLGVDHCGHRYGPVHSEMTRKLNEMNDVLKSVIERVQNENTLLFVIGDHGMTSTGDHGGDTDNEITSAIFVYSPIHPLVSTLNRTFESINQVDIVPTLSTIFGTPIPFSNVGSVIPECIPTVLLNSSKDVSESLWRNVEQITNYIRTYSQHNSQFTTNQLETIIKRYTYLKKKWPSFNSDIMMDEFQSYMTVVLDICQEVWVRFSETSVIFGLISTLLVSLFAYFVSEFKTTALSLVSGHFLVLFFVIFALITIVGILCADFFSVDLLMSLYFSTESFSVVMILWFLTKMKISIKTITSKIRYKFVDLFSMLLFTVLLIIPFSNSFVLEEPKIVLFLFITLILFVAHASRPKVSSTRELLSLHFITGTNFLCFLYRMVLSYAKCRGEEDYECQIAEPASISAISCLLAILSCIYFANFNKIHFQKLTANKLSLITCALMSFYWICEVLVDNIDRDYPFVNKIPGILFIFLSVLLCVAFYDPVLRMFSNNKSFLSSLSVQSPSIIFANSFTRIRVLLGCICVIVLGQLYAIPAIAMNAGIWFLAYLTNVYRSYQTAKDDSDVPWSSVMLWCLSSVYWFYTTGHNTSFSSIQWNAAFLIQKDIGDSVILPGILVATHTFLSQAVHSILLMLLLVFPYFERNTPNDRRYFNFGDFQKSAFTLILRYLTLLSMRIFFTMLAACILRRHLMMWGVFAPKFIFEGISFVFIVIPFSFLGYLFTLRVANELKHNVLQ